ncbi:carboxypeptidase regulatory-like domain-containing protein [Acidicapsa dinghuensis]|uniref:Carboxypeptidase regulatory-like domain-containing protein n=1 Tax=Acidicapsa dinghuensis TaxID=2218256 RepID=A0ABW1EGS2_9BACT|nr:carboxypeptidase regulatory-like domain-containing protein [Acidicapsa dinghuensis]
MKRIVFVLALLACCLCPSAKGQIDRTEINGTVTDPSGASVAGATITVTQIDTNQIRSVMTASHGEFSVSSLPIGHFSIRISHSGFRDLSVPDIDLHAGDVHTVNLTMTLGEVNQTVTIQAHDGSQLDESNATLGGTVQHVQVSNLPLNGRNITNLELLAPGAIDSASGSQQTIRFEGNGTDDNNFRLDGVDAGGVFHASLKSALRLQFSTEAIAEFKVDSGNYTADTGGSAGAQVSLISKTGTNNFHGSVFDYFRNNVFDAVGPIKSSNRRPVFQLNQFGGDVGGPIKRDRTFFFANYEGFRQQLGGVPQNGFVPSSAFLAETQAAQPELAFFLNAYPHGEAATSDPRVDSYTSVVPSPDHEDSGTARVDHRFGEKDSAYLRYNADYGVSTSALNALGNAITINANMNNAVLEEEHIISATITNEAELGFNRNLYYQSQTTGLPINFTLTGLTELQENYNKQQVGQDENLNDTLTWIKGKHTVKFGAELQWPWFYEANSLDGTAAFLNETTFLADQLSTYQITAPLPDKGMRKFHAAGYFQDEWKATRDLTVNYGLRYSYFSPFTEVHNAEDPFDIASCGGYCGIGTGFYFPNYLDFDPRLSLAWAPEQLNGHTVFRAGFGTFHGEVQLGDEDSPVVNTEPSTLLTSGIQSNGSTVIYSYPVPAALTPTTGLALTPRSMARNHPDSYIEQWTASIEQAIPGQSVLTLTYLGSHGVHLFRRGYTNLINPATGTRPLPQFPSEIDTKYNEGMSNFNALQVGLRRHLHNGLFFGGNYMYSHAIDDGSVGAGDADAPENIACFRCDYASSDFDSRHSGTASVVYTLPFGRGERFLNAGTAADLLVGGWSVDSLLTARSGFPVNILLSRPSSDLLDGNNVDQRPDVVPGAPLYLGHSIAHWLNPAAFSLPAAGAWGNAGRNTAVGPTLWQDDAAVQKTFHVGGEQNNVIFRAESFNIFNRAQYGQPASTLSETVTGGTRILTTPSSFGKITSTVNSAGLVGTGTPRVLEFSLRITY